MSVVVETCVLEDFVLHFALHFAKRKERREAEKRERQKQGEILWSCKKRQRTNFKYEKLMPWKANGRPWILSARVTVCHEIHGS